MQNQHLFANPFTTTRPAVALREREQFLLLDEAFEDETFIADATVNIGLGAERQQCHDREPESADYQIVNISAGVEFQDDLDVSIYVSNLLDENALLSSDRERGGRARLGFATNQPRTIGVTVRKGF